MVATQYMEGQKDNLKKPAPSAREAAVLEALYFLTPFDELRAELGWTREELVQTLTGMIEKGWVVQFIQHEGMPEPIDGIQSEKLTVSLFVASREGLLLHNSRL